MSRIKSRHSERYGADPIDFLATPVIAFTGAAVFGGSGFLAAFVAGLLFHVEEHMAEVQRFFHQMIYGVARAAELPLVGALADLHALIAYSRPSALPRR